MTGAQVPEGADCVIVVEETVSERKEYIRYVGGKSPGNICFQGEDIRRGDVLLRKGTRVRAQEIAVLASAGYGTVAAFCQPLVGIASTGNELYPPGQKVPPGSIRDSNSYQLYAQVVSLGLSGLNHGIVRDTPEDIQAALQALEQKADVILITGGVSAGDYDFVPEELDKAGYTNVFYRVAIKPGMPLWFGTKEGKYCFGLPGNPVSTFVQFEYVIKPFLYKIMGSDYIPRLVKLPMGEEYRSKKSERDSIIPVKIKEGKVHPVEYHGSAHISAIPRADGFIMVSGNQEILNTGDLIDVRLL